MAIRIFSALVFVFALLVSAADGLGQKRTRKTIPPKTPVSEPAKSSPAEGSADPAPGTREPEKKNSRSVMTRPDAAPAVQTGAFTYIYEFSQPDFIVPSIKISHDDTGKGEIVFAKKSFEEVITDPIQLSSVTLANIRAAMDSLDFLNSTEVYQTEQDYSHMGNVSIFHTSNGRSRKVQYNWTTNKAAKALSDEYRKISNQYIWIFDITVARDNQPLDAPRLLSSLDSYLQRGEISDPPQMIPLLKALGDDERIPLIARNHAGKLIASIEKQRTKAKK